MTLEILQKQMFKAMKNKDKIRKDTLSSLVSAVKKTAIDKKCKDNIAESLIDEVILKEKKTVQEMIDTCPAGREDLLGKYTAEMEVVKQYAPQLMTDRGEIVAMIMAITSNANIELTKSNRGTVMKTITPYFKGKADMKIVSQVVGEILE